MGKGRHARALPHSMRQRSPMQDRRGWYIPSQATDEVAARTGVHRRPTIGRRIVREVTTELASGDVPGWKSQFRQTQSIVSSPN